MICTAALSLPQSRAVGSELEAELTVFEDPFEPAALPVACAEAPSMDRALVVFSSAWCEACNLLERDLRAMRDELTAASVDVVFVYSDVDNCEHRAIRDAAGSDIRHARIPARAQSLWGVYATPTSWVIRDGNVVARMVGAVSQDTIRTALATNPAH